MAHLSRLGADAALADDPAVGQVKPALAALGEDRVVRDQQQRRAEPRVLLEQLIDHRLAGRAVEIAGRLVGQQQRRAGDKSARGWASGKAGRFDAYDAKAEALALLEAAGAPVGNLQLFMGAGDTWHPGRSAKLGLGPKKVLAAFGELHPKIAKALEKPETLDPYSAAHLTEAQLRITKALDSQFIYNIKDAGGGGVISLIFR